MCATHVRQVDQPARALQKELDDLGEVRRLRGRSREPLSAPPRPSPLDPPPSSFLVSSPPPRIRHRVSSYPPPRIHHSSSDGTLGCGFCSPRRLSPLPHLPLSRPAQRKWVKLLKALEHERSLGVHELLAIEFPAAYPDGPPTPADEPPAARWKLDRWEGPQIPAAESGAAGSGRLRLKMKRNFAPDDHRLASPDVRRSTTTDHGAGDGEVDDGDGGGGAASPAMDGDIEQELRDEQELREEQMRQLISELPPTEAEVVSDDEAEELEGEAEGRPAESSAVTSERGGGGESSPAIGEEKSEWPMDELTEPLDEEPPDADGVEASAADREDRALLLSLPCKLVRLMALQPGRLQVFARTLRFVPDAPAAFDEPGADEIAWVRDGEPEVRRRSRVAPRLCSLPFVSPPAPCRLPHMLPAAFPTGFLPATHHSPPAAGTSGGRAAAAARLAPR